MKKRFSYNKETDMRVLLGASDEQGVTRRVLEEAALGSRVAIARDCSMLSTWQANRNVQARSRNRMYA